jgi:1-acyl-sn-glycerol-3-phosphate acyltransferase
VTFVAKSDVRHWPIFGRLATAVNTIFLDRNKPSDIKRVLLEMHECLKERVRICIFPEGTSSNGKSILQFKSNLFQSAIDSHVPTIPLLIQYRLNGVFTDAPAYYADITLIESFRKLFSSPNIVCEMTFLDPITADHSRQALSEQLRAKLLNHLHHDDS